MSLQYQLQERSYTVYSAVELADILSLQVSRLGHTHPISLWEHAADTDAQMTWYSGTPR